MSDFPKNIQVIFDNNPMLFKLIPNPVLISDSPFVYALSQKLCTNTRESENDDIYKIVFKKNSSRELMTINSGELRGLLTSTCIEKGKISNVAGLKKIEIGDEHNLMAALLGISLYGPIQANLSYISQLCTDIRNHQIIEDQSRFERVSETIVDCFRSIPDLALDRSMRDVYLSRIVKNNDDCHEIYITQRERFKEALRSEPELYSTGYGYSYYGPDNHSFNPAYFFEQRVLAHSVFAVFERLVAGRVCEIVISGNYSNSNIRRHRDFITRVKDELNALMDYRLTAFNNFTEEQEYKIKNDPNLYDYERKNLKDELNQHKQFTSRINKKILSLLEAKIDSFDILSHLMDQDEIDVFLIDGKLLVNNPTSRVDNGAALSTDPNG